MNFRMKSVVAGVSALALAGAGLATAVSAAAYPTTTPAWVAGDTSRNGEIFIYNSSGAQVTGGTDYNALGNYFAGQTTTKTTNATLANLSIAFPDSAVATPSTWFSAALQPSTAMTTTSPAPTAVGPVIAKANWPAGATPIADTLSGGTLSTTTNYQNVFELRMTNSGAGGVNGGGRYWAVDIEFNPAATGSGTVFDTLQPQAWRVLQAVSTPATTTTVSSATPALGSGTDTTVAPTFTATVSPSAATGTVQFKVNGVNYGSAVAVSAGSATSAAASVLTAGSKTVTAVFTATTPPANTIGYADSTSANVTYVITQGAVPATTTTLQVTSTATPAIQGTDTVTVTAVVTQTSNSASVTTGSVQFFDGANSIGTDSASPFTLTVAATSLTVGTHSAITAVFTPTDVLAFSASTSSAGSVIIGAPLYANVTDNISTSIGAGTLIISSPYNTVNGSPLALPEMTLNTAATEYSTSVAITGISVADTRAGNLPYTLSAIASNLYKAGVSSPTANQTINAQNVGLNVTALTSTNITPATFLGAQTPGAATSSQNITGFNNASAAHVAAADAGSLGLGGVSSHIVEHVNAGLGTTVTNGTLSITAPSNTVDGTYTGTITFSIIGS